MLFWDFYTNCQSLYHEFREHPVQTYLLQLCNSIHHINECFLLRLGNVFVIGKGTKAYISLPKGKGVKLSAAEERDKRLAQKVKKGN